MNKDPAQIDLEEYIDSLPKDPPVPTAPEGPKEYADKDLPHPFLKRITEIAYNTENPQDGDLNFVRLVLTTFAHLSWPGDVIRESRRGSSFQLCTMSAVDYVCAPIPEGSPLPPPRLREGVYATGQR